jgi:hypothetical protein|tara:strand:- start:12 stop:239 length:228 start_codon:yes stop_codon:yes gene_type:complete
MIATDSRTTEYNTRHGGPYDRGSSDAYYGRRFDPHYYAGDTYSSPRIALTDMAVDEIVAYTVGYRDCNERKAWGE